MNFGGIAVEGVDGSGKSTLVTKLAEALHWPAIRWPDPAGTSVTKLLPLINSRPLIWDRLQLTPVIYGKIVRGRSDLSAYDLWAIEGLLSARGYVVIRCNVTCKAMLTNVGKHKQLFGIAQKNLRTIRAYFPQYKSDLPTLEYHYERSDGLETLLTNLRELTLPTLPYGVLGTASPCFWVVGEEKAKGPNELEGLPFWGPNVSDKLISGTLLFSAFQNTGLNWKNTALCNTVIAGKPVDLKSLYKQLGRPKVVALGKLVSARLTRASVPHSTIPHPQYWRRFHYKKPNEYFLQLDKALAT